MWDGREKAHLVDAIDANASVRQRLFVAYCVGWIGWVGHRVGWSVFLV